MSDLKTIQTFLSHIFTGELSEAEALIAEKAIFIAVSSTSSLDLPLHGKYIGPREALQMFTTFGEYIDPGEFHVEQELEAEGHVVMYGHFKHKVRATGAPFNSDWCLICKCENGKLVYYHFYEDSAAYLRAAF